MDIWMTQIMDNIVLGDKIGLRQKWPNFDWEPPYPHHLVPKHPPKIREAIIRHGEGCTLALDELPEASAVYSMSQFKKTKRMFYAGGILVVTGKVADVLLKCDFGRGGGLISYSIFEADERTPLPNSYYLVNFGERRECLRLTEKPGITKLSVNEKTGVTRWDLSYAKDDDISLSSAALEGADIWMSPGAAGSIFMKDHVARALKRSDSGFDFDFRHCKIINE